MFISRIALPQISALKYPVPPAARRLAGALLAVLAVFAAPGTGLAQDSAMRMPGAAPAPLHGVLSLEEAERLAVSQNPQLAQSQAELDARRSRSIYAGQAPDPQLKFGIESLPVNTFAFDQDSMTQVVVGFSQMIPQAGKLRANQGSAEEEARAAWAKRLDLEARIKRDVRKAWFELFYQQQALTQLRLNHELLDQIVRAALAQYGTGKAPESDALKAQLDRDQLLDQEQSILSALGTDRSKLARLINEPDVRIRLPDSMPALPFLPPEAILLQRISHHPQVAAMEAQIRAGRLEVAAAESEYNPEFGVEANYGYRMARQNGSKLPDMVSVGISMSLPIFPEKRQSPRVQERRAQVLALRYQHDDMLLQLRQEIQSRYAVFDSLKKRLKLIDDTLLPQSGQVVSATLAAYAADKVDMASVLRARRDSLDLVLRKWRLRTELAAVAADLRYLATTVSGGERP